MCEYIGLFPNTDNIYKRNENLIDNTQLIRHFVIECKMQFVLFIRASVFITSVLSLYIKYAQATISTHILDTSLGKPSTNVPVSIYRLHDNDQWLELNQAVTDANGRINQLLDTNDFKNGVYKLKFNIQPYFQLKGTKSIYPYIEITLLCEQSEHYHVPLLISPYSYTTYRGS